MYFFAKTDFNLSNVKYGFLGIVSRDKEQVESVAVRGAGG